MITGIPNESANHVVIARYSHISTGAAIQKHLIRASKCNETANRVM
ncbi:MAG: hypothetical protein PHV74_14080 [Dehalococcoidia bacterium]|nr:hypothetical protein [Dehalococcoidia bacterium]